MAIPLPHSHLTTDPKGMDRRPTRSGALPNVICPLERGAPPLPVWTVLVALGTSPPLTVVRGTASQELRGGPIAFLCQVNGHLDVLRPLLHLRPGTADRDGVSFSDHGRSEAEYAGVQELPGGHDDGLPLATEGQAVGHTPFLFALLDLWRRPLITAEQSARHLLHL